jgi:hypothetical protein
VSPTSSSAAIAEIANKYRQRGYAVTIEPPAEMLPVGVQDYRPDFVAIRDDEKVAIEVKSRRSLGADPTLTRLEKLRRVPGWRLDVAVIEESGETSPPTLLSRGEIHSRLATAGRFAAETNDYPAALLLVWTAVEAALHARLKNERDDRPVSPNRLAKMAVSLGIVDDDQLPVMEWLVGVRNAVVHGHSPTGVSAEAYARARELAEHIIIHATDDDPGAYPIA